MKSTRRINFAFDTRLMVCLRDNRDDGELQVSFEGSLRLQLAAEGVQSLCLECSNSVFTGRLHCYGTTYASSDIVMYRFNLKHLSHAPKVFL